MKVSVDLPKELFFEYSTYPPAKQALRCVCDRLGIALSGEETGGTLSVTSPDRSFEALLTTTSKAGGGLKVQIRIQLTTEEQRMAVTACFGEAKEERKTAPPTLSFAEAVLATEYAGDLDAFVRAVCNQIGVDPNRFGSYRAVVLTSSSLPGASDTLRRAAQKLRRL